MMWLSKQMVYGHPVTKSCMCPSYQEQSIGVPKGSQPCPTRETLKSLRDTCSFTDEETKTQTFYVRSRPQVCTVAKPGPDAGLLTPVSSSSCCSARALGSAYFRHSLAFWSPSGDGGSGLLTPTLDKWDNKPETNSASACWILPLPIQMLKAPKTCKV